jgi:hypothetical protein
MHAGAVAARASSFAVIRSTPEVSHDTNDQAGTTRAAGAGDRAGGSFPGPVLRHDSRVPAERRPGDAYTFRQFQSMFDEAGFRDIELHPLPPSFQHVITAVR